MKVMIGLLLGLVTGGFVGWYVHGLSDQDIRAADNFVFLDKLADQQASFRGRLSWRPRISICRLFVCPL